MASDWSAAVRVLMKILAPYSLYHCISDMLGTVFPSAGKFRGGLKTHGAPGQ
ncbi:unnamed protein product [Staurois parvus]|uniref:Uncharacterized protein n=1 Tax=Staurois parvus TaxID=386267 RepID=A0ABN9CYA3_9NEOB|nr:unnamed protein product [Staurois parvus]